MVFLGLFLLQLLEAEVVAAVLEGEEEGAEVEAGVGVAEAAEEAEEDLRLRPNGAEDRRDGDHHDGVADRLDGAEDRHNGVEDHLHKEGAEVAEVAEADQDLRRNGAEARHHKEEAEVVEVAEADRDLHRNGAEARHHGVEIHLHGVETIPQVVAVEAAVEEADQIVEEEVVEEAVADRIAEEVVEEAGADRIEEEVVEEAEADRIVEEVVVVEAVDRQGAGEAEEAGLQAVVEAVEEEGVQLQIISKFTSDQFVQACPSVQCTKLGHCNGDNFNIPAELQSPNWNCTIIWVQFQNLPWLTEFATENLNGLFKRLDF